MNDLYQTLNRAMKNEPTNNQQKARLPKDQYAKMKMEQRQALYDMAQVQCKAIVSNENVYLQYLNLQSRLDYTVTNTMLVFAQMPNATMLKDNEHWRENNSYIKKGEKGIRILEPKGDYTRADGTIGTNYDVKSVFDISQVNTKLKYEEPKVSPRNIISGLVYDTTVHIKEVPSIREGKSVAYSSDTKTIFYASNLEPNELIQGLAREFCYAEFDYQYGGMDYDKDRLFIESSAYMLCKKYGIEVKDTSFVSDVVEYFEGMDSKNVKEELSNIKNLCDDVSNRVERGIYKAEQEKRNERQGNVR